MKQHKIYARFKALVNAHIPDIKALIDDCRIYQFKKIEIKPFPRKFTLPHKVTGVLNEHTLSCVVLIDTSCIKTDSDRLKNTSYIGLEFNISPTDKNYCLLTTLEIMKVLLPKSKDNMNIKIFIQGGNRFVYHMEKGLSEFLSPYADNEEDYLTDNEIIDNINNFCFFR